MIQRKIELEYEKQRTERENSRKQYEFEKNQNQRKEDEYLKKLLEQNNTCTTCKLNYCKCDIPNFIVNMHNKTICTNCNKRKCKCIKITNFFKNKSI
jgi:hypothetical protein